MENLYLYTVVSRREGVNASRDPVSSRDIYFLYEFGRGGRLFDTASLVISGRQIRIPCRGGRDTQEAVVRGSIDSGTHQHAHARMAGQNDRWRQFVSLSDEIPRTWLQLM